MKRAILLILVLALLLCGCTKQEAEPVERDDTATNTDPATPVKVDVDLEELFTDRDYETAAENYATITLNGTSAVSSSDAVQIDGTTVTITDEGAYRISGSLNNGQIVVNADKKDKTQLILDGVAVTNDTTAPLYIAQADKVFITLQGENSLANTGSFTVDSIDGVVFSKEDVTFNGEGSLTVSSAAGHGIVSKDELTFTGGKFELTTASHGVAGKDNVCIDGGSFSIAAGKDGIHSENNDDESLGFVYIKSGSFAISCEGDGVSAAAWMQLDGGEYDITAGGGSENGGKQQSDSWGNMGGGMRPGKRSTGTGTAKTSSTQSVDTTDSTSIKGVKSGGDMVINGGTFAIDSADDAVHSNGNLTVTDGSFTVATGDDGFHAEETLQISGGTVVISESYEGLEALHVKVAGGDITLTASDDGLNAAGGTDQSGMGGRDQFGGRGGFGGSSNGSIVISGGKLNVTASGDGIDANGTLEVTGGYTVVCGPTQGDTATLDYDISAVISGGTFLGTGASGMAQTFSDSKQGVIALSMGGSLSAGTKIKIADSTGKEILSHEPALNFAVVILSCPEMQKGESYKVTIGTASETITAQ